jgi:hypothetical protein
MPPVMLNDSEESLYILLSLRAHMYWPGLTGHQYYKMGAVGATLGSPAIEKGGGHNASNFQPPINQGHRISSSSPRATAQLTSPS